MNGIARKEAGLDRVEISNKDFVDLMRDFAITVGQKNGIVSTNDLRQIARDFNIEPAHPNAWGTIFRGDMWRCVGRTIAKTPSCHAREIKVWALCMPR